MNRQAIHRRFLEMLLALRGEGLVTGVRLVARLYHDELLGGASVANTYVFIPDLHLVTATAQRRYRYGFTQLRPGVSVSRPELLHALGDGLMDLRAELPSGRRLTSVVLGDFLDLWREDNAVGEDVTAMADRILAEFPDIEDLFVRTGSDSLNARLLVGNHELWGKQGAFDAIPLTRARRSHVLTVGSSSSVLATHGDRFDPLETTLPDEVQEYFVENFGPLVNGSTHQLDRIAQGSQASPASGPQGDRPRLIEDADQGELLPDWVNVWATHHNATPEEIRNSHDYLPAVLNCARKLRKGNHQALKYLGLEGYGPLVDLRVVLIGHTHHARISVHIDAMASANNLVLVDCGAWLGSCRLGSGTATAACQIGVLCGGDVRLYQLDPA
jgi:UDP-2,3-diacylglucosamine pyrophosphatase LpxH